MISAEELRLSLLPGPVQVALTAADEAHEAAATLGLEPWAEPDGPGPSCGWCGRTGVPLEDQSLGGPAVHECTGPGCHETRALRLENWMTAQTPWWQIDFAKYKRALAWQAEQAARARYGGGIYAMAADQVDAEFLVALDAVRMAVEPKAVELAEQISDFREFIALAADNGVDPAEPKARPAPARFDPWAHTMRNPANRTHTLGAYRQHKQVTDAAAAVARKAVRDRREL